VVRAFVVRALLVRAVFGGTFWATALIISHPSVSPPMIAYCLYRPSKECYLYGPKKFWLRGSILPQYFVTTAIDYPNGVPHAGHLYEKLVADCYARWHRHRGDEVFFLTGTDENGQKLQISAEKSGQQDTLDFVTKNAQGFQKFCNDLQLTNSDFIRTTEQRHVDAVYWFWEKLQAKGDIYFDRYKGNYCYDCESFYPENQAPDGQCPHHGTKLIEVEEEGYFFKMSRYGQWIKDYIESHKHFIFPDSAREEMLGRLRTDELRDLSISRPNKGWGIPVPNHPQHVIYTWFDALINYYAPVFSHQWPANVWPASCHVIGKDINWFHSVIWPIMLHGVGLEIPRLIHVHGMVLAEDGRKMSKSLNNALDPYELIAKFPLDSIRYAFLRGISSGNDGRLSVGMVTDRHNNELANELGNMVSRCIKLTMKRIGVQLSPMPLDFELSGIADLVERDMASNMHNRALDEIWTGVAKINAYLNEVEPWRIKDDDQKFHRVMYTCVHGIFVLASLLKPFLPDASDKVLAWLGMSHCENFGNKFETPLFHLSDPLPLFARFETVKS